MLKKEGYLTRDPRMKERKKYGLKAARRGIEVFLFSVLKRQKEKIKQKMFLLN